MLVKNGNYDSSIVAADFLHLRIHGLAFLRVGFRLASSRSSSNRAFFQDASFQLACDA